MANPESCQQPQIFGQNHIDSLVDKLNHQTVFEFESFLTSFTRRTGPFQPVSHLLTLLENSQNDWKSGIALKIIAQKADKGDSQLNYPLPLKSLSWKSHRSIALDMKTPSGVEPKLFLRSFWQEVK